MSELLAWARSLVGELKRRKVFRVAVVYGAVAFLVVQAADIVFPALQLPGWTLSFVVLVALLGFPLALVLAWGFELTPDGLRREQSRPETAPAGKPPRLGSGRLALAGFAIIVLAGLVIYGYPRGDSLRAVPGVGMNRAGNGAAVPAGIRSIAVLPFVNMSPDAENEYFSDGLTEELLNALAQIEGLRVAARTSAFAFKGVNAPIGEIGRQLNVETVLEGSVRRTANRLRITTQLINVADGYHVWSRTFEREIADIFEIQDEISEAIIAHLLPRFAGSEHHGRGTTTNVAAYELYLQARYVFWQGSTEENLRSAAELYEAALRIDPDYAVAHAGLADALMLLAPYASPNEVMPRAKAAALRALELDPLLAEGYVALASINWFYDWDWRAAAENYRRSFSVNRVVHTRCICYVWYLAATGRLDEAVAEAQRSRALDPVAPLPATTLAQAYYLTGRFDDARAELAALEARGARSSLIPRLRAWMLHDEGRILDAVAELEELRHEWTERGGFAARAPSVIVAELAFLYGRAGRQSDARTLAAALSERAARSYVAPEHVAAAYAAAGEPDTAVPWLDRALENRSNLGMFSIGFAARALHDVPRFAEVLAAIGLSAARP